VFFRQREAVRAYFETNLHEAITILRTAQTGLDELIA